MQNSYGFIKLCYGVVGSYKDTSKMTLDEVVEEFLRHEGVRSAEEYYDKMKNNTYGKLKQEVLTNNDNNDIVYLPDIQIGRSVGSMAKNFSVFDPSTCEYFEFVEGSKIRNPHVFAGNGSKKPLKKEVVEGLTKEFGGDPHKWQHIKGVGTLNFHGEELEAEVHWFQEESVGKVKFKVKEWLE